MRAKGAKEGVGAATGRLIYTSQSPLLLPARERGCGQRCRSHFTPQANITQTVAFCGSPDKDPEPREAIRQLRIANQCNR